MPKREFYDVEVHPRGECVCESFLSPITTWSHVAQRHNSQGKLTKSLAPVAEIDDYELDMFRCTDCGRYWVREEVGFSWLTKSYTFFYHVELAPDETPEEWFFFNDIGRISRKLRENLDADYYKWIEPNLALNPPKSKKSRRNPKNNR